MKHTKNTSVREAAARKVRIFATMREVWVRMPEVEFHAVIHRHMREGAILPADARDLAALFSGHIEDGLWNLIPVTEALLAAAACFGLAGRSI